MQLFAKKTILNQTANSFHAQRGHLLCLKAAGAKMPAQFEAGDGHENFVI